ncbi:ferrous ion transport protein [Helicobacter mustelae]|uniref:FeoA family protein n=1 Tax=Helicobacter mustelae TaxID=217 RepID=UPI000E05A5E4|nr:FeoA family protein [Helicobacter mustelae]STP12371.1 ferrous ion transport protein [Helicobacter mustelae]
MTLLQGQKDIHYKITQILSQDENLKRRLFSFGLTEGSVVSIIHSSMYKSNIAIIVGNSQVALRNNEASQICIELAN